MGQQRLDEVVVDAVLQLRFVLIARVFVDGRHDGDVRVVVGIDVPDEAGDLESMHLRQQAVKQDQIRPALAGDPKRLIAAAGGERCDVQRPELFDERPAQLPLVFDDQYRWQGCIDVGWVVRQCRNCDLGNAHGGYPFSLVDSGE